MKTQLRFFAMVLFFFSIATFSYGQAIKVNNSGKVGIGMDNPTAQLELKENEWFMFNSSSHSGIIFHESGDKTSSNVEYGAKILYDQGDDMFRILARHMNDNAYGLNMDRRNGHISIGDVPPAWSYSFRVQGSALCDGQWETSDKKFKENLRQISNPGEIISQLNGKKYSYKDNYIKTRKLKKKESYGLIAQEVLPVLPELVMIDDSTGEMAVNYTGFIPILIESVKDLQKQVNKKETQIVKDSLRINKMQARLTELEKEIQLIKAQCCNKSQGKKSISLSGTVKKDGTDQPARLYQNYPNPFDESTTIDYYLPETTKQASLYFYDMSGNQLKSIPLEDTGNGSVTINGGELSPGMYMYTLIANGKEVDTKKMILTE